MWEQSMLERVVREANPELKQLVVEASRALAFLDADRLEELALSCKALSQDQRLMPIEGRRELARQAREASADMAVFARVLEATGANLKVMQRLRELRTERLEYRGGADVAIWRETGGRAADGDN